ncbi:MAG: zinc-ribbon domain-containing protein [Firmicutes bacterium]|nr:zinc-ribbon domain-containing protein [Bacillota bacterium]
MATTARRRPSSPAAVHCGAEAEPGAKFCLGCGRILR